nr:MAG TPA: hypothetical protein [Caudoviricetes sp.]
MLLSKKQKNLALSTGEGQMDRTEANVEAKKIFDKWNEKTNEIEKKAKKDGIWKKEGLDSNNYLFKEINEKAKLELAELESQIYEMKKVEK